MLLLAAVRGVLGQLVEHIGAGRVGDVQVVGQGCAVGCGAGEGMFLIGFLCRRGRDRIKTKNQQPQAVTLEISCQQLHVV